jgi:aspartoacylase
MNQKNKVRNVLVSGGTHGNEYTGAFLARHWLKDPSDIQRPSFKTHTLFANPDAFAVCRRYVDRDLNRSFNPSGPLGDGQALELKRAREIENELREKCLGELPDVIFDLHTTTAQMGLSLVLTNREPFNILLYAYLRTLFPDVRAYLWEEPSLRPGFLNSLSAQGFAIEVGPVANGVLHAGQVFKTSALVGGCLDFIEKLNSEEEIAVPETVPLFCFKGHADYPRDADGLPAAMIHPSFQGSDFRLLQRGDPVFIDFSGKEILWTEKPAWPVFINEAAYYEKGIAFTLTDCIEVPCRGLREQL